MEKKFRLFLLLALLLTAATGAWAQTETLLTTITPTAKTTYSETTAGVVTVTPSSQAGYSSTNGWLWSTKSGPGSVTVDAKEGYTITRCVFKQNDITPVTITTSPFAINFAKGECVQNDEMDGVTSIEVYGYANAPASAGYTVSLKDGVKDAGKWTVKVGEGQAQALPVGGLKGDGSETVTLQYNGRLKVKGVKATSEAAQAAKEPATVTTAPTGAAIVGVGKNTELVSGGAADGGTLMYQMTTTNTKPASTDGFSATVPTAKDITASGKVYVWYYVKADDTHSDSEIAATAIEVPVADIVWDVTNVTDLEVYDTDDYYKEGITLIGNAEQVEATWKNSTNPTKVGINFSVKASGGFTFTAAPIGKKFTKIEMKPQGAEGWDIANLGTGWTINNTTVTWTGSASSTVDLLKGANSFNGKPIISIAFYLSE